MGFEWMEEQKMEEINKFGSEVLKRLERMYNENKDVWVKKIVDHAIRE